MSAEDPGDPRPCMPPEPQAGECCQSGCDPCVYDLYWDAVSRYERAIADWEARRAASNRNLTSAGDSA